jgi:hypothetical protein
MWEVGRKLSLILQYPVHWEKTKFAYVLNHKTHRKIYLTNNECHSSLRLLFKAFFNSNKYSASNVITNIHTCLHVKCPLFLFCFSQDWNGCTGFNKILQYSFHKNLLSKSQVLMHTVIIEHFYWWSSGLLMFLKMTLFLDTKGLVI